MKPLKKDFKKMKFKVKQRERLMVLIDTDTVKKLDQFKPKELTRQEAIRQILQLALG